MTPDVKAKVLAAAARLAAGAGEIRPGFAARAVEREAARVTRSGPSAPRTIAGA